MVPVVFVPFSNRPLSASSRGNLLCQAVATCAKGDTATPGWTQICCNACTKKVWREKVTSTRESVVPNADECITCHRQKRKTTGIQQPHTSRPASSSVHARPTFVQPRTEVLEDLGISMETFRQLRSMQLREIGPEDYDLLMRLHEKPSCKVSGAHDVSMPCHSQPWPRGRIFGLCRQFLPCSLSPSSGAR